MADNQTIRDGDANTFTGSLEEQTDGSFAPRVAGTVDHDTADDGSPVKIGAKAVAHGSNPTAVAAADRTDLYANRHGILFTVGAHPNPQCVAIEVSDTAGAQSNLALIQAGSGQKIAVTRLTVFNANTNTGDVDVIVGFASASLPTPGSPTTAPMTGVIAYLKDMDGNSGVTIGDGHGIIGMGGDGEDLRLTCDDPAGGFTSVMATYFIIES